MRVGVKDGVGGRGVDVLVGVGVGVEVGVGVGVEVGVGVHCGFWKVPSGFTGTTMKISHISTANTVNNAPSAKPDSLQSGFLRTNAPSPYIAEKPAAIPAP
jgi:hypothetical protein